MKNAHGGWLCRGRFVIKDLWQDPLSYNSTASTSRTKRLASISRNELITLNTVSLKPPMFRMSARSAACVVPCGCRSMQINFGSLPIEADNNLLTDASLNQRWNARCSDDDRPRSLRPGRPNYPERVIWNTVRKTRPLSTTRSNIRCISAVSRFDSTSNSAANISFM